MVQREVADRFFARRGTKAYGAVSVLVRLQSRRTGFQPVPPTVFRPRPRVDSALVAFERVEAQSLAHVRSVVDAAFAHRRKTLANSLAGVGLAARGEAEAALSAIGQSSRARAEELEPEEFVALADALEHA
jgi:16S rRNA (adenine1518-N6/adenine1519-N6)-dimethyltransferase